MTATAPSPLPMGTRSIVRGRNVIALAVVDLILAVVVTALYGPGHQHGFRNVVSSVSWVMFLVGFVLLVLMIIAFVVQSVRRRSTARV